MTNYTGTPQATTYPLVLHTGTSTPSKALGSILGRVVSGICYLSDFDTATPLQAGSPVTPLSSKFLTTMDQIRLHLETKVTQAGYHGPLDFTLHDFKEVFDATVTRDESSRVVFGVITRWYGTVYVRQLHSEKGWRDLYEDSSPLTRQQETTLFQVMRSGLAKDRLRDLILRRNGGLVRYIAKRYEGRYRFDNIIWHQEHEGQTARVASEQYEREWLFEAGKKGLEKAVDKFDPLRGYRFSTCAFPWIRGEITDAFKKLASAARREEKALLEDVAACSTAVKKLRCWQDYPELNLAVGQALARLNDPRKTEIITLRYGLFGTKAADTLKAIAEPLGITPQRVHAILNTSLARLKKDQELRLFYKRWFYW